MPKLNTKAVARAVVARAKRVPAAAPTEDCLAAIDRDIVGRSRAQLRIPLLDPVQVKRDLTLARASFDNALKILGNPDAKDRSVLIAIRSLLEGTNRTINAKWQGYAE